MADKTLYLQFISVGHTMYRLRYATTRGRFEQSIDMQGGYDEKRWGREQRMAVDVWGEHDMGSKSQSGSNLGSVWEG